MHNVHYQLSLMSSIRQAILDDRYPAFLRDFFDKYYGSRLNSPQWAVDALRRVGVDLHQGET
jgi:queuine tRNA-ribosyltransferase